MIPLRLYLYAAAALALVGGLFYVRHLQHKAARVDAAEAKVVAYQKSLDKTALLLKQSEADRLALNKGLQDITGRFKLIVIPKTLTRTVEVPGACSITGVSADFVSVYNAASSP